MLQNQAPAAERINLSSSGISAVEVDTSGLQVSDAVGTGQSADRPVIETNRLQIRDICREALDALNRYQQGRGFSLVNKNGRLSILRSSGTASIETLDENKLFALLSEAADWVKVATDGTARPTSPRRDVIRVLLAEPREDLPRVQELVDRPYFCASGLRIENGFHHSDEVHLSVAPSLVVPTVRGKPTSRDVTRARDMLCGWLIDFPFEKKMHQTHFLAALFQLFVRRLIQGPTPLYIIEAPAPGCGKTLLGKLLSILETGTEGAPKTYPAGEVDMRKVITSALLGGKSTIWFDNVNTRVNSGVLASVLTSYPMCNDRVLGQSREVEVPNQALWIATGNNIKTSNEIARRCIQIRINSNVDNPFLRTGYQLPDILAWTKINRGKLIHAILTLIQDWNRARRPVHNDLLGSFEDWSRIMGGILTHAGFEGFLDKPGMQEFYSSADHEGEALSSFAHAWRVRFGDQPVTTTQLCELCAPHELLQEKLGSGSIRSRSTKLGIILRSLAGRFFDGCKVQVLGTRGGITRYQLCRTSA